MIQRANAKVRRSVSGFPVRQMWLLFGAEPHDKLLPEVLTLAGGAEPSPSISGLLLPTARTQTDHKTTNRTA